jgi:hypothetical protein
MDTTKQISTAVRNHINLIKNMGQIQYDEDYSDLMDEYEIARVALVIADELTGLLSKSVTEVREFLTECDIRSDVANEFFMDDEFTYAEGGVCVY